MSANILVIDADKLVAQLLEKALVKAGHTVTAVEDPLHGLRMLDEKSFDLVITDIGLRRMSGIQVLERVKALDDTIEVIVFAGAEEETFENALAALRLGACDFLTKPLRNMDELMVAVELALDKRNLSTNVRRLVASLDQMRSTDFLTGVFTRRYFLERVSVELRRARRHKKPVTCMLIDIDHLEQVNRDYGRPCGDQVLAHVARAIALDRRVTDTLARYGGEEFVVAMAETRPDQAVIAAEKIRKRVEEGEFSFGGQTIPLTVSIGIAGQQAPESITELIDQAHLALLEAKRAGRNRVQAAQVSVGS